MAVRSSSDVLVDGPWPYTLPHAMGLHGSFIVELSTTLNIGKGTSKLGLRNRRQRRTIRPLPRSSPLLPWTSTM